TTPKGWQTVDGLCTFWVKDADPKHGKVLRFDTDVLQSQAYDWWTKISLGAKPMDAPKKLPTTPPQYDTIAAFDGTWFYSDFVPVKPGKAYWLSLDVKGPEIMVWLLGYKQKESNAYGAEARAFLEAREERVTGKKPDRGRNFNSRILPNVWKGQ